MGKDKSYTDAELQAIAKETARRDATEPRVIEASYKAGKVVLAFSNGAEMRIPADHIQGLAGGTVAQKSAIIVAAAGTALHWDDLDVQMSVEGLVSGVFGTARWMRQLETHNSPTAAQIGRRGGAARTAAKAASARENGRKGGRPRKAVAA